MNVLNKFRKWLTHHKTFVGLLVFLIIVALLGIITISLTDLSGSRSGIIPQSVSDVASYDARGTLQSTGESASHSIRPPEDGGGGEEVEVKEANIDVDSENARQDSETVRSTSEEYDGYIEQSNKSETNTHLRINMTTRVPSSDFESFIEDLQNKLEVEDYSVNNFRIPVQREIDELDIIRRSLDNYATIRQDVMEMTTGEEKISLLMEITNKELELKEREKRFERSLVGKQERSDMATVRITLEERLEAELWPEEIVNRFRDGLKNALDDVVESLVAIVTGGISFLFQVINWMVYSIIFIVPVALLYKLGRKLYRRFDFDKD